MDASGLSVRNTELASCRHMEIHLLCLITHFETNFQSEPWLIILDNLADLWLTYKKHIYKINRIIYIVFQQHWDLLNE